jgi:hypothetical protein
MDSSFWKAGAVKENRKNRTSDKSLLAVDFFWESHHVGFLPNQGIGFLFCF